MESPQSEVNRSRVVPWYRPEQFCKVYEYLYDTDITKKRWAVDQISVWDTRCHPSLPTGIEASMVLTRAIIQDVLFAHGTTMCQEKEIQMLYCTALVRFVNLSIEFHQSYKNQTVSSLAQGLGIPSWIVDLRNEATHSLTPSLPVLRMGADAAMKYLDRTYWRMESKKVKNFVREPIAFEKIKELILDYQVYQYKLMGRRNKASDEYGENLEKMKTILHNINKCVGRYRKEFIEALVMDGFFIIFEEDMKLLLTQSELSEFYDEMNRKAVESSGRVKLKKTTTRLEDENSGDSIEGEVSCTQPVLPKTLEEFWCPLLYILNKREAMPDFVEGLLYTQANRSPIGQRLLTSWVIKILKNGISTDFENNRLSRMFRIQSPLFDWSRLLFAAVSSPCIYTPFIFPLISCHMDLDEDFTRSLMNLLAISQGQALDLERVLPDNHTAFTLEKLKQSKKLQDVKISRNMGEEVNVWSLAPDNIDFSTIPIGAVLNSSEEAECNMEIFKMDFNEELKYSERCIWGNKNDEVKNDDVSMVEVEQNTFEEDKKAIRERKQKGFLYKK